ncbi:hypothetical protein BDF20DRAFT_985688 [Mycotypha africana]|uniref:uncharacterized protein n=1 Tax=Mycotypha africana TaxID=64632 RepID=UPI0023003F90|nr:uncharacterized protein BDF20DRAFT_985688 [Mycotypha africana]KAI8988368.1 hypothetical protein BDF20DRAFT_985688 [Mycotypha africana]
MFNDVFGSIVVAIPIVLQSLYFNTACILRFDAAVVAFSKFRCSHLLHNLTSQIFIDEAGSTFLSLSQLGVRPQSACRPCMCGLQDRHITVFVGLFQPPSLNIIESSLCVVMGLLHDRSELRGVVYLFTLTEKKESKKKENIRFLKLVARRAGYCS